jgi:hypothetical protein
MRKQYTKRYYKTDLHIYTWQAKLHTLIWFSATSDVNVCHTQITTHTSTLRQTIDNVPLEAICSNQNQSVRARSLSSPPPR